MDSESRKLLEEVKMLVEKDHQLLKSINRSIRLSRLFKILYWVIILGLAVGAYYYVQPYIDQLVKLSVVIQKDINSFTKLLNSINMPR